MESWVQSWRPRTNAFCDFFPLHLSTVLAPALRKIDARSYEVLHLSRKIISANLKIWCSKIQPKSNPSQEISVPDLPTSLMNMSFVLRLPREMHLWRSSSNVLRLPSFLEMLQNLAFCSLLTRCAIPCAYHAKRALNVQKWSVHGVLCAFWLRNVLRATTACAFSTSQLPKVVRDLVCFVHFYFKMCFAPQRRATFHLSSDHMAPHTAALASLLFDPPEPQIIGKTPCFVTFLPFRASAASFFWLFLFSDLLSSTLLFSLTLPISAFHLSILSEVWLLNFLRTAPQRWYSKQSFLHCQEIEGCLQQEDCFQVAQGYLCFGSCSNKNLSERRESKWTPQESPC